MKYIDPKNFRLKNHIDWKAQAENMKEIAGIVGDMVKETDWSGVAKAAHKDAKGIKKRLEHEVDLLKNMSPEKSRTWCSMVKSSLASSMQVAKWLQSGVSGVASRIQAPISTNGQECGVCFLQHFPRTLFRQ
nr:hypothetical protein [Butyrivibrio proteoclasticus]